MNPWDKWINNYENYRNNVEKIFDNDYISKVLIWNVQSLNKGKNKYQIKMEALRNVLNNNRYEFIFLIDCNNYIDYINLNGFRKFSDNRNVLFIKDNIHNEVKIEKNLFIVDKIAFAYILPKCNKNFKTKIIDLINNNYVIFADWNLKSNKDLNKYVKKFNGEDSLQIGVINNNPIRVTKIKAPSDHLIVIIKIKLKLLYSMNLKIKEISFENSKKIIKKILNNYDYTFKPKIIIKKYNNCFKDKDALNNELLDHFINNDVRSTYKRYNYMWKYYKKEPILGVHVNKNIENGFKEHLKHINNKEYKNLDINEYLDIELPFLYKTKSKALNYDYMQLNSIYKSVRDIICENYDWKNKVNKNTNILRNLIIEINKHKEKLRANTFFLIKNKRLENFNDTRMIVIMPVLVKIYELLIFEEVNEYISDIIIEKNYQFGGIRGGSTFRALINLRMKMKKNNCKCIFFLDMSKGYDTINLDKLENMIVKIKDKRIQTLLRNWCLLVKNLDIVINNNLVKKTRGIPMGLSLSPIIFVFYIHNIINEKFIKLCTIYIDDIALCVPDTYPIKKTIEMFDELIKLLNDFDLVINLKKSIALTEDTLIKNKFSDKLEIKNSNKYLGRELKIGKNGDILNDDFFFIKNKVVNYKPKWLNFAVKRMIYNGAIDAGIRYKFYMWPTDNIEIRKKIFQNAWNFFKSGFSNYSYVQLSIVSLNLFRYIIDPMLFYDLHIKLEDGLINATDANLSLTNNMKTKINQVDKILDKLEINWGNYLLNENNLLEKYREFTEDLWFKFRNKIIEIYKADKLIDNTDVFNDIDMNSKLIKNCYFILDIIFNHIHKNRVKMYLLWQYIKAMELLYDNWKTNDENWKVSYIFNTKNIDIKKIILVANYDKDQWIKYAKNKNKECWRFLYKVLNLERKIKQNKNSDNIIDKKIKSINKKNEIGENLSLYETFLISLNKEELLIYKTQEKLRDKKNKKYLKESYNNILKSFFIFDSIYCDNAYNNMTYYELSVNLLLKFDDLEELSEKILRATNLDENLDYLQ